jgi:hypothetical protein
MKEDDMTPPAPVSHVEPLGYISAYGLEKLQTRRHYCVSVSHQAEKEYVIPIFRESPPTQTKTRVKPLVWREDRTAKALGAKWMVWPYSDPLEDGLGNWLWQCVDAVPHTSGRCHSEEEAINAAQVDYQRRVLDLLVTREEGR